MMPELDGFGLVQGLRTNPRTRTIPVILLSARAGEEARSEGMVAGADDYLVKPFSARELVARVGAHLRLARARSEAAEHARRLSEVRLGLALESTQLLAWEWDPNKDEVFALGDMKNVFGADLRSSAEGFQLVCPGGCLRASRQSRKSRARGRKLSLRVPHPAGRHRAHLVARRACHGDHRRERTSPARRRGDVLGRGRPGASCGIRGWSGAGSCTRRARSSMVSGSLVSAAEVMTRQYQRTLLR